MKEQKMTGTGRVVVTGLGVVSANGTTLHEFWENVRDGKTSIGTVTGFDTSAFNSDRGGEVTGFDIADFISDAPDVPRYGRAKQMALSAAQQCIADSGYDMTVDPFRVGVVVGTTMGESKSLEFCTDHVSVQGTAVPLPKDTAADYPPHTIPQAIAKYFGAWGTSMMIPNACAAGNFSVGYALDCIKRGEVDAMITGGTDAFSRYAYSGFARLGAMSPTLPRPFSAGRQGMIPGEGAAMLFLESLDSAVKRGARIYAEVIGYGESCDAHHITQPDDLGIARAMHKALQMANIDPEDISFISVHGTGTEANDSTETKAIKRVFKSGPPVTSVKSMIGHAMGAASSIECVAALLSMHHDYITPTANYSAKDPACDVDCVPNVGRSMQIEYVLKTSSAFGGNNSSIIFKKL
jgi:3-oxoacyl-[acyl-carrier-protein] synthase II